MALATISKSLSSKLGCTLRFSSCIQPKVCSIKKEPQNNTIQICTLWAGSTFSNFKQQPQIISSKDRKPKHPANVFLMYLQKVQQQIQKDHPEASRKEIVTIASQQWKNVDPEEKSLLTMQRKELFEKYKNDMKNYIDSMTPEEIRLEEKRKQQKMAKKLKMARRELGMPKMPGSAFTYFMSEQYSQHSGEEGVTQIFKKLRNHWDSLSEKEKEKYKQQSTQKSEVYKEEMERWEKEMMELGRFDVIRKSTLLRLAMGNKPKKSKKEVEDL
ncbi:mitochondrial putative transcription factor a [Plakobranchus ocellatus]|uniref:Mitochondrial putative transcription factor a n=1 Tax=Plakobranchus ocellatus TaxID=259542 RepID=A0AAV4BZT7_9GAST|nr:mitochondrial putative transcription factor a [Plakobranchus ocellatus]